MCAFVFKCKLLICTHLGGAFKMCHILVWETLELGVCICIQMQTTYMHTSRGSYLNCSKLMAVTYIYLLQIIVLSSNTKKGEIERTSLRFCVLGDNTNDSSKVFCDVGSCETIIIEQLWSLRIKKGKKVSEMVKILSVDRIIRGPERAGFFQIIRPLEFR